MTDKLPWNEIKRLYPNQWVELVDFEWDEFEPDPRYGVVRHYAQKRKELHDIMMQDPVDSSAVVYVGNLKFKEGTVFSANLHQYSGGRR